MHLIINNSNLLHKAAEFVLLLCLFLRNLVLHLSVRNFLDKRKNWRISQSDTVTCLADKWKFFHISIPDTTRDTSISVSRKMSEWKHVSHVSSSMGMFNVLYNSQSYRVRHGLNEIITSYLCVLWHVWAGADLTSHHNFTCSIPPWFINIETATYNDYGARRSITGAT